MSNPVAALYWLTGAIEYNLSFGTLLVLISLLYRGGRSILYYFLIVLLSIAIPAQHEVAGTLLCGIVLCGAILSRFRKIPARHWYFSLVATSLSLGVVVFSPGNARRAAQEHTRLWDLHHAPRWIAHSIYHELGWLSTASILAAAICIVLISREGSAKGIPADEPPKGLAIAGVGAMVLVLCVVSTVEIATGDFLPDRVLNWFEFVFWLSMVCAIFGAREIRHLQLSTGARAGAFILLGATLFASWSFRSAVKDLHGSMQSWWQIDSSRLKQRGGNLEFETPALYSEYPNFAVPQALAADPDCYVNRCLANYLHAQSVVVKDSTETCPVHRAAPQ